MRPVVSHLLAGIGEVVAQRLQNARQIDRRPRLGRGVVAGERVDGGNYPEDLIYGRTDATLGRLAEEVTRFGAADLQ